MCVPAQSCPALCDTMDCGPPGSSVHGILQARLLEWIAMPPPGDVPHPGIKLKTPESPALQLYSIPLAPPGNPFHISMIWKFKVPLNIAWF